MRSKKFILKYLARKLVEPTISKYLDVASGRKYFLKFRDRVEGNSTLYHISLKGNYIRAFTSSFYVDRHEKKPRPTLILKVLLPEYKKFTQQFIKVTPTLNWLSGK